MRSLAVLETAEVHVWQIRLSQPEPLVSALRSHLSHDERQRAARFVFDRHRRPFIVAHAAMRQILSRYVQLAPETLSFSQGEHGKPELVAAGPSGHIRFNLSHSGSFALLAVAQDLVVGIDVERVKIEFAGEEIAERYFSRNEVMTLREIAEDARPDAFFSCWTRKEAFIKALGGGLSIPLDSFDVAFGPGVAPALLRVPPARDGRLWSLYDIPVPRGYKAALVIEGKNHRLRRRLWKAEGVLPQ